MFQLSVIINTFLKQMKKGISLAHCLLWAEAYLLEFLFIVLWLTSPPYASIGLSKKSVQPDLDNLIGKRFFFIYIFDKHCVFCYIISQALCTIVLALFQIFHPNFSLLSIKGKGKHRLAFCSTSVPSPISATVDKNSHHFFFFFALHIYIMLPEFLNTRIVFFPLCVAFGRA